TEPLHAVEVRIYYASSAVAGTDPIISLRDVRGGTDLVTGYVGGWFSSANEALTDAGGATRTTEGIPILSGHTYRVGVVHGDANRGRVQWRWSDGSITYFDAGNGDPDGLLLTVPSAADFRLGPDDIAQHQVRLVETQSPWKELTLRWRRNYHPLTTVAGSVEDNNPEEAARLRGEWRERRGAQNVDDYPLAEHVERNSALQTSAGATAERDRLLALRSVRREVWAIEAFTPPVEVGMAIEVEHPLLAGRVGRIISVSRTPTHETTELEVWM